MIRPQPVFSLKQQQMISGGFDPGRVLGILPRSIVDNADLSEQILPH
jgi:hypothetical protein